MLLSDFVSLLKTAAPDISKNKGPGTENYTTWSIGAPAKKLMSDDQSEDIVRRIYVDHYTHDGEDPIPCLIEDVLDKNFISYELVKDDDQNTKYLNEQVTKYHHYSFTCYVG